MFFLNNDLYVPTANGGMTTLHVQAVEDREDEYLRGFLNELSEYEAPASDTDLFAF